MALAIFVVPAFSDDPPTVHHHCAYARIRFHRSTRDELGEVELGLVEEKRGNKDAAAAHFRTALAERPEHGEAVAGLKRVTAVATPAVE